MNFRHKQVTAAITLLVVFAVTHTCLRTSIAATVGPSSPDKSEITGILSTDGNQPIIVNGSRTLSGATISSGASILTPEGIGAIIAVPGHGTIRIRPATELNLDIGPGGNLRLIATRGCVLLNTKRGTAGELINANGEVSKADPSADNVIDGCPGLSEPAGAGSAVVKNTGLLGLGIPATVAIIGSAATIALVIALSVNDANPRGTNPSPF